MNKQDPKDFIRCAGCRLHQRLCMCKELPTIECIHRIVLIVHHRETKRPTNTGLLACQCLPNSEVHVRGQKETPLTDDAFSHIEENYEPWVLFPRDGAEVLDAALVATAQKPIALFVPDGNWGQASRTPRRYAIMRKARHVLLPLTIPTEYRLRKEVARPEGLATMEAIARAMRVLHSQEAHDKLLLAMRTMVMRTLWSKGSITTKDAAGFLPIR